MIDFSNYGQKSGLREWVFQRVSSVYILFYFLFFFLYIFFNNGFTFENMYFLFSNFYFKLLTILAIFSLSIHSSIGVGIILSDYIKNYFLRLFLEVSVNISLIFYIFYVMQVLLS